MDSSHAFPKPRTRAASSIIARLYFRPRPASGWSSDQKSICPPVINWIRRSVRSSDLVIGLTRSTTDSHCGVANLLVGENHAVGNPSSAGSMSKFSPRVDLPNRLPHSRALNRLASAMIFCCPECGCGNSIRISICLLVGRVDVFYKDFDRGSVWVRQRQHDLTVDIFNDGNNSF
jgi:hypothetical protein